MEDITKDYRKFTGPAELHKAVNTLRGIMAGITTDLSANEDEINELTNWISLHEHLEKRHPFSELIPIVRDSCRDGIITKEEATDVIWLCNNFISDSNYYDLITSSLQFLSGMLHGVLADNEISDEEIKSLQKWISSNGYLAGCYPFDEIESLVSSVLLDGKVSDDERSTLKAFFSNFVDLSMSYNLNEKEIEVLRKQFSIAGICSVCQEIDFKGKSFCFTGKSDRASRDEIAEIITSYGGKFQKNVTSSLNYLIVGVSGNPCWAYSCYGRKIEESIKLRQSGKNLMLVSEVDFWDIIDDMGL